MSKEQQSKPLSRKRENDDGNTEGNEVKIQEAISSLRTLVSGESDVTLFVKCLEPIFILSEISIWLQ
jgi:hypothetical protein